MTTYNFGEKKVEKAKNKEGNLVNLEVYQTPKYLQSKEKAISLIAKGDYGLEEGDFWILMNKGSEKMCYTGLIISHNGCLKINDKLEDSMKFKPSSVSILKDEGNNKVMKYVNDEQGVYEFGEIAPTNCKNEYPYAMVLKRLMDRVILKNSKVGFFGIYSEAESDEFKEKPEVKEVKKEVKTDKQKLSNISDNDMKETQRAENEKQFQTIKALIENSASEEELKNIWVKNLQLINKLKKYAGDLFTLLEDAKNEMKVSFAEDERAEVINN